VTLQEAQERAQEAQANVRYLQAHKWSLAEQLRVAKEDCRLANINLAFMEARHKEPQVDRKSLGPYGEVEA
jgi:hypothetical protein